MHNNIPKTLAPASWCTHHRLEDQQEGEEEGRGGLGRPILLSTDDGRTRILASPAQGNHSPASIGLTHPLTPSLAQIQGNEEGGRWWCWWWGPFPCPCPAGLGCTVHPQADSYIDPRQRILDEEGCCLPHDQQEAEVVRRRGCCETMPADKPTVNVATASSTPGPSEPAVRNGCPGPVRLLGQGKFGFGAGPNVSFGADGGPARVQSQLSAQFSWAGNICMFQQSWKNRGGQDASVSWD